MFVLTLFTLTHVALYLTGHWAVVVSFQLYLDPTRGYASHVIRVESLWNLLRYQSAVGGRGWIFLTHSILSLVIAYSICFIALNLLDKYTPSAVSITGSYLEYIVGDNIKNLNDVVSASRIEPIDTPLQGSVTLLCGVQRVSVLSAQTASKARELTTI